MTVRNKFLSYVSRQFMALWDSIYRTQNSNRRPWNKYVNMIGEETVIIQCLLIHVNESLSSKYLAVFSWSWLAA